MMNHIYKFRLISMTMLCLLLSCTTPNPVEEAKVEMQKEYHAYFDNTISMIEQYNWVLYNPQIEMFARFKMKSSFHKTKRII